MDKAYRPKKWSSLWSKWTWPADCIGESLATKPTFSVHMMHGTERVNTINNDINLRSIKSHLLLQSSHLPHCLPLCPMQLSHRYNRSYTELKLTCLAHKLYVVANAL